MLVYIVTHYCRLDDSVDSQIVAAFNTRQKADQFVSKKEDKLKLMASNNHLFGDQWCRVTEMEVE